MSGSECHTSVRGQVYLEVWKINTDTYAREIKVPAIDATSSSKMQPVRQIQPNIS